MAAKAIYVRVPAAAYKKIEALAKAERRSMSAQASVMLEKQLKGEK